MITLKNDFLQVKIEETGAQPCSLYDIKNDRELLWTGEPPFWKYHSPVLFPFVGNFKENRYRYQGKTYLLRQHGFAREKVFRLQKQTDTSAVWVLEADEQTKEIYPFDFCFTVTQSLADHRFVTEWIVQNPSEDHKLFFSVGAHPAFRVPVNDKEHKNDCYVLFSGKEELTYILKDPQGIGAVPKQKYTMRLDKGLLKIEDHLFDIDTFIFEDGQIEEVSLCGKDKKPYVTVSCKGFPYFGLWTQSDDAPFVCLEPWYGRLDDIDFEGELPEKAGILKLEPGEMFQTQYEIVAEPSRLEVYKELL